MDRHEEIDKDYKNQKKSRKDLIKKYNTLLEQNQTNSIRDIRDNYFSATGLRRIANIFGESNNLDDLYPQYPWAAESP